MPTKAEQDWSDSDSDCDPSGDVETSVQLGIPDGSISSKTDLCDPCVSKIGGHPVRVLNSSVSPLVNNLQSQTFVMPHHPDISCSQCKNCSSLMQMLVQIWCPLEDSPMDRALYVWACPNGSCQKKDGRYVQFHMSIFVHIVRFIHVLEIVYVPGEA
jgi:pre-rRNA-processing protein TSR4